MSEEQSKILNIAEYDPDSQYLKPDGEIENHGYIDLGLPSGNLWSTCNLGAQYFFESGDYLSFDDSIFEEYLYKILNQYYELYDEERLKLSYRIPSNIIIPNIYEVSKAREIDPVTLQWGKEWKTPEAKDINELLQACDWDFRLLGGKIPGYLITGTNEKRLFLPCMDRNPKQDTDTFLEKINSKETSYYNKMEVRYLLSTFIYGKSGSEVNPQTEAWRCYLRGNKGNKPQIYSYLLKFLNSSFLFNIRPVAVKRGTLFEIEKY